jgi:hypothetical protein
MNYLLRLFLTLSSVSFFLVVFLVQNEIIPCGSQFEKLKWLFYLGYLTIPFILALLSLSLCKKLSNSTLKKVDAIETSNNDFLANYLAFFFVALSVKGIESFCVVFGLTILFTFYSRVSYFNPVFLVFGYNFYYILTEEKVKIMLISKRKLKNPNSFEAMTVKRINDYTYFEG